MAPFKAESVQKVGKKWGSKIGSQHVKTNTVLEFIENRVGFWSRADSFPKEYNEIRVVDISDIFLLFSSQAFWIGIFASMVIIAGIVYVRSSNSDQTID